MKFKKKTAMAISFALGTVMFATTAFAEVASKSGYDQFKDSIKFTTEACTTKLSSYTSDLSFVVKDNGKTVLSRNDVNKANISENSSENVSKETNGKDTKERYSYSDNKGYINKNSNENIYYSTEFAKSNEPQSPKNPFKEKQAADVERIADAIIGNLKDSVIVTENANGTKEISGKLNESQIPPIINAIVSFQTKNIFRYDNNPNGSEKNLPKITKDVIVKEVSGKMIVSKDGLIQSVVGTGVISGKDDNNDQHNLTFDLLGKLYDINSTTVKKPDLSGKKVVKSVEKDHSKLSNPEKYVGKYKADIIIEKDNKFEKIGEKFIEIEQLNSKTVTGKYYEKLSKGFENYSSDLKESKFTGTFNNEKDPFGCEVTVTNSSGNKSKTHLFIDPQSARVDVNINRSGNSALLYTSSFTRVFD